MRLTLIRNVSGSKPGQGSMLVVVPPDELEPRPLWLLACLFCRSCYLYRSWNSDLFCSPPITQFYFFRWRYSPLWALACRTIPLHFSLSITSSLHLLTPSTWRSLSTSFLHPFLIFLFVSSLPVLEWRSFWASYPPPFSPGDPAHFSFAPLSILLYFLLYSTLLILDSSYFPFPHKSVTIPLYPPEILQGLACGGTRACVMQFRKQTVLAVAHSPRRL